MTSVTTDLWGDLAGQAAAVDALRAAAGSAGDDGPSMTHSWLITGPPGSGRSNIAYAFAAALLSEGTPESDARTARLVRARSHPDLTVLSTERVIITIDEVRRLIQSAQYSPSVSRYRVLVIEDADRMTERTSNLLLKSLEEPAERTVWILCAPSEADLLPTIRSRVRTVRLTTPTVEDVAGLLVRRHGIAPELAEQCARQAQSHIGMARRLATDEGARARRQEALHLTLEVGSTADAVRTAARLLEIAGDDAKAVTEQRDADERASLLHTLGVEEGQSVPPALRSSVKQLEEDQKRRATRSLRDGLDRILVDLLGLYRDVVLVQLGRPGVLLNRELDTGIESAAQSLSPSQTLAVIDALTEARERIAGNVSPALALEAVLVTAIRKALPS